MDLDEAKLEALRSWGEALRQADSEEHAAVGRAIVMLIEEIDRLHIALWHTRLELGRAAAPAPASEDAEAPVTTTLHDRLQRVLRRRSDPVTTAGDDDPTAAQSWIEALRRRT
jgi:chorismate mutase